MEQLLPLLECPVCRNSFNDHGHIPYVLVCGHNICSTAITHLFRDKMIKCPKCRKENVYENIKDISKNYMALDMIKTFQKTAFINFPNNPSMNSLNKIPKMINDLKNENQKIKEYFAIVKLQEQLIVEYNEDLIRTLTAYRILQEQKQQAFQISVTLENEEPSQLLKKKQGELKNIKKRIDKEIALIFQQIVSVAEIQKKEFQMSATAKHLTKKIAILDKIDDIEVVRDYINLTKSILKQIDIYQHWEKNYKIQKVEHKDNILALLIAKDVENQDPNQEAAVILGFLNYHGIIVDKNKTKAKEYYEKAAEASNPQGCFLLYWFDTDKIDYLFKSLDKNFYPNALNALGFEFRFQDLIKQKLKLLLYQLAANKGSTFGKFNTGIQYEDGKNTTKNLDLAAHWYQQALEDGYLEAKEQLDMVYDETIEFKMQNPDYQKWGKSYEKFYNQKIILL